MRVIILYIFVVRSYGIVEGTHTVTVIGSLEKAVEGRPIGHVASEKSESNCVNAINDDRWRHMVVLKKGQVWGSRTVYRAWKE